eukprot:GEMP01036405.1.p1 GENE.GEMP01036405.1~~GEMP01036405.1.p1  ORF type:complete len:271 (+),score=55.13 GEMP01036405.1:259-1071(+)
MAFASGRRLSISLGSLALMFACGGIVFSVLEREAELREYKKNQFFYRQMRSMYEFKHCKEPWFRDMEFCKKQEEFHELLKQFFARNDNNLEDQQKWTIFGAIFFVMTLVTTLGYGTLHPITTHGMVFTIMFGMIGIPTMAYALSLWGRYAVTLCLSFEQLKKQAERPVLLWGTIFIMFVVGGALCFIALEGWTPIQAVYFTACTMMTIGFGDVLPTYVASKIFTMVFIVCTLGFGASLIATLTQNVEVQGRKFAQWYGSTEQSAEQSSAD